MLQKIQEQLMEWFDIKESIDININGLLIEKVACNVQTLINPQVHKYRYITSMGTHMKSNQKN